MKIASVLPFLAEVSVLCALLLFQPAIAEAQQPAKPKAAPALRPCQESAAKDLGKWDDVFALPDQDFIVLRRGEELFSLPMVAPAVPKKLCKTPAVLHTEIVAASVMGQRCWLFLKSTRTTPCAVDANSGLVVPFEIPGLDVPGRQAPTIQSSVLVPHTNGAILEVSGGDPGTWPRDGNRPMYFRLDLTTGKATRFPLGWDLRHFSADERVAVFAMPLENRFDRRPLQAIDMKTGAEMDTLPDLRKEYHVPFVWYYKHAVRPLVERRVGQGDGDFFAGLSVGGVVLPVDLGLKEVKYLSMAKASDGFAGFLLRRQGGLDGEPRPLWIVPFKDSRKVEVVADDVTNFAMLGHGNAIYMTTAKGPPRGDLRLHDEAHVYLHADKSSWQLLDGIEGLPKLDQALANKEFIDDSMSVRMIQGFGSGPSLVLCLCTYQRHDRRALIEKPAVPPVNWRRALLVTHDGQRALTSLFRDGDLFDLCLLHISGKLLLGTYIWTDMAGDRARQVRLSELTVQLR